MSRIIPHRATRTIHLYNHFQEPNFLCEGSSQLSPVVLQTCVSLLPTRTTPITPVRYDASGSHTFERELYAGTEDGYEILMTYRYQSLDVCGSCERLKV